MRENQPGAYVHAVLAVTGLAAVCALGVALSGCHSSPATSAQGAQLDFNKDVQPILASNCFSCHGPDPAARKAGLRLDLSETAFKKRPGKKDAIVPGHPESSELIARIESKDPHHLMPQSPEGEAKPMKPAEIAVLKQWIAQGAHYAPHWAFQPPVRPQTPQAHEASWAKTPIDRFVLAKLEAAGMHHSAEADKATLIRRVTLDLTGLLPTPAEVAAFEKDSSPDAYETVVDRLLASPRYGEHRTRYWLDYARYADTYGIHYDDFRMIWPYRDYIIRSFNANKPFNQFVKEQIAGDMLPASNLDQILATGYVRAGVSSNEGGAILEELRFNIARERAEAYGATFLGLTVGCAVCHDHKYDPTTQKDFYQLTAFFNNVNEEPFNGDRPDWLPAVRLPKPENEPAYNRLLAQRSALLQKLSDERAGEQKLVQSWLASKQKYPQTVSPDKLQLRLRFDEGSGKEVKNSAPNAAIKSFTTTEAPPLWGETTWQWPDFRMDSATRLKLGQTGDFDRDQSFSGGGWVMVRLAGATDRPKLKDYTPPPKPKTDAKAKTEDKPKPKPEKPDPRKDLAALIGKSDASQAGRGWQLWYQKGSLRLELVNTWPGNAISVVSKDSPINRGTWHYVSFTYDGSGKAAGVKLYIDGQPAPAKVESDSLSATIRTPAPMQLCRRSPDDSPLRETRFQDLRLYARALSAEEAARLPYEDHVAEIVSKPVSAWTLDERHAVGEYYFNHIDETAKAIHEQVAALDKQLETLGDSHAISIVAQEKPSLPYANVLNRGIYSAREERVLADTPHFLPPLTANEPHNRLGLAEWTISDQNPLMARVAVNRMWNEIFGAGLVATTEDFGIMGQRPSNSELLDWLAVEFRQSGWNVKHMYKLMVMSAAYRQSARSTPELTAKDPGNLLLARGPRFRMDAEMLRDIALQSSGLLVSTIGGPSVKTYQPPNIWESVSYPISDTVNYVQDHGDALYRRSMYTFWKRMAVAPDMDAFDAPPRDVACTRRQRTNTPLQALVTMNDPQWVEASRALAERVIRDGGAKPSDKIGYLSELLLSHPPSPRMESVLEGSYRDMEKHYAAAPNDAHSLLAVGEKPSNKAISAPELAAWTMVASEMLNLDETLNK